MKKLLAIYFSGTGNTAYAVDRFCSKLSESSIDCKIIDIEHYDNNEVQKFDFDTVLIAYPIYGSDIPRIMREFILNNLKLFQNKDLITLVTQHSFSGDGGALAVRLIKEKKAHIASIHINMPSNISDSTNFIKIKNGDLNNEKIAKANVKIDRCATEILNGRTIKDGTSIFSWIGGFFGQRLVTKSFFDKSLRKGLKIDDSICSHCGKCADYCPMKNIKITEKDIITNGNCTLCYRCINLCPKKAISLISKKKPVEQYEGIENMHLRNKYNLFNK